MKIKKDIFRRVNCHQISLNLFKLFKNSSNIVLSLNRLIFLWNSTFISFQIIAIWSDTAKLVDFVTLKIINAYFRTFFWFLAFSNLYFSFIKMKRVTFNFSLNLFNNLVVQCFIFETYFIKILTFAIISLMYHCKVNSRKHVKRLSLTNCSLLIVVIFEHFSRNKWIFLK